jgi:hypothetical protein
LYFVTSLLVVFMQLRRCINIHTSTPSPPLIIQHNVLRSNWPSSDVQHIVTCWGFLTTSEHQMWRVYGYWRRRSDCYFVLFTTSLVVTTITFTMWHLLGWLRLHFRVDSWSFAADLIWFFVSDRLWFLCSDVASLIGSFDLPFSLLTALK